MENENFPISYRIKETYMRILIILNLITLLSFSAFSQSIATGEIIVEGGAKAKVRPDIAIFTLSIEKRDTSEKNSIFLLNLEIEKLIKSLSEIGFTEEEIKISDHSISSTQNEHHKKLYNSSNSLKIQFKLNTKIIDAVYNKIQDVGLKDLDVAFESRISDSLEKATRVKLVQYAIGDAKNNANNISQTLGLKLNRIKQVRKNDLSLLEQPDVIQQVKFTSPKVVGDTESNTNLLFMNFQFEDVELEEKIIIVYEIT